MKSIKDFKEDDWAELRQKLIDIPVPASPPPIIFILSEESYEQFQQALEDHTKEFYNQ